MKLRYYFFAALTAVCLFGLTSCNDDNDPTLLSEVKVSQSYLTIVAEGGSSEITVNATAAWDIKALVTIKENNKDKIIQVAQDDDRWPSWLTVTPDAGEAGTHKVTFSTSEQNDSRAQNFVINCAGKQQRLTVQQGVLTPQEATVKDVIEGPLKSYRVTGTVTSIKESATYGNFYINDGTSETDLYIYGTKYDGETKKGALVKYGIEVGDIVTIEGPKQLYGTTVEMVDVDVLKIVKSLIKIEKTEPGDAAFQSEGGELAVYCTVKGNKGVTVELTDEQREWISLKSVQTAQIPNPKDETLSLDVMKVTFDIAPNADTKERSTSIALGSSNDKGESSTVSVAVSQLGMKGTIEFPMTPVEAIEAANAGATSAVYVKGIVSKVVGSGFAANYGNGSFWISEDGEYNDGDKAHNFEAYQVNWLGGEKWTEANPQIVVGAEVVIYGPLTVFNGTAETQGKGAGHVYSINGVTTDENGVGTLDAPFNALGGIAAANAKIGGKVYVEGIVSELYKGGFDASYGNGSFYISVDGVRHKDNALDFEAYQVNYLGNRKWNAETDPQIAVGDRVVVYGPLTLFNGLAETSGKGAAYLYMLNGETGVAE